MCVCYNLVISPYSSKAGLCTGTTGCEDDVLICFVIKYRNVLRYYYLGYSDLLFRPHRL